MLFYALIKYDKFAFSSIPHVETCFAISILRELLVHVYEINDECIVWF